MSTDSCASDKDHPMGGRATPPLARPVGRLAMSLRLAGIKPAALSLRASHPPKRTIGGVQLRFLGSFLDEGALDHVVAQLPGVMAGHLEAAGIEQSGGVGQHRRAAADHRAIAGRIERRFADVGEQLA